MGLQFVRGLTHFLCFSMTTQTFYVPLIRVLYCSADGSADGSLLLLVNSSLAILLGEMLLHLPINSCVQP